MSSKQKKQDLVCPCCKVTRGEKAKQYLKDIELRCKSHEVKPWGLSEGWSIKAAMSGELQ